MKSKQSEREDIRVHINWMIRRDFGEVLAIESESFRFPWGEDDFIRTLRQRVIPMTAEHDGRVVGFMIYELHGKEIHVLNFAVGREFRRRSVGSQMVAKLFAKLSAQRRNRITLEVCETNLAAQLFFRENGFQAVDVLRNFYDLADGDREDAYLMEYRYQQEQQQNTGRNTTGLVTPESLRPCNRISKYHFG